MANPVEIEVDGRRVSSEFPMPIAPRDGNVNLDGQTRSSQTLTLFDGRVQTVTNVGRVLKAVPFSGAGIAAQAPSAALRVLGCGIDNTMSELIVAYAPLTATQSVSGSMQAVEY